MGAEQGPGARLSAELADVREEAEQAHRDVDEAQAARRAAEAAAARLRAMVAGLNAIVWERDPQTWRFRFVNDRVEEVLGYPLRQWLDETGLWQRILHPDDAGPVLTAVRAAIAEGEDLSLTYRVRAADGRWVWLQHLAHVARDEAGTATAMHSVLVDVTDSKRRELAAALLAAAGRVLTGPGSVEERLATVTGLLVPDLCDWAAVWLRGDDERFRPARSTPSRTSASSARASEPVGSRGATAPVSRAPGSCSDTTAGPLARRPHERSVRDVARRPPRRASAGLVGARPARLVLQP
ncbi:MAG: PAS domain-containing protein [Actinomycetes bacterium]